MKLLSHNCMRHILRLQILIFFFFSNFIISQNTVRFEHINDENGMSGNSVLTIIQDFQGFMWFGTRYGLNRYDGYSVRSYYSIPSDSSSINNNFINKIYEDNKNDLWIATNTGINRYNRSKDKFTRMTIENDSLNISSINCLDIVEDAYGNFWVFSSESLFQLKFPDEDSNIIKIKAQFHFNENRLKCVYIDESNKLLIGTKNGLYQLINGKVILREIIINGKTRYDLNINRIYAINHEKLALATENTGLIVLNKINNETKNYLYEKDNKNSLINNRVRTVFQDEDGKIWLGTREGLSVLNYQDESFTNYIHKSIDLKSISDNSVKVIYGDDSGGIWIGTYAGGINYYHKQNSKFKHIKRDFINPNTISSDKVSYIYKDKKNTLWIGTEGRGLNRVNEENGVVKSYSNFSGYFGAIDNVKAIAESDEQFLWIGTNGGLSRFDRYTGKFKNFFHNQTDSNSISYNQIHSVLYDSGVLWIGTNGGGLNKYLINENRFLSFKKGNNANDIISNNINHLLKDDKDGIWIGTENGIDYLLPDGKLFNRSYNFSQLQNKLLRNKILVLLNDDHDYLWIGTEGNGVFCVNKKNYKLQKIADSNELVGNIIYSIEQDNNSNIWVSTNKGLSSFSLNYNTDSIALARVYNYKKKDGLQGNQFSYRSSFKDKSGKLYFGGIHGYNTFYPDQIEKILTTPPVVFTNFEINYKKVGVDQKDTPLRVDITQTTEIDLKYSQQPFSITYAGLNYINPENTFYSYKLMGVDDDWIKSGKQRTLTYTQLKEGNYELRVKASDNNNEWSDNYTKLSIKILPPYWRTWWAYLGYLLLTLIIIGGILMYTNNWFHLKNRLTLEKLSKEKEHELHEKKIRFFTDVSHELRTPLTLIISPLEKLISDSGNNLRFNKDIKAIERNSKKMLLLINQLLDLRKFEKGHAKLEISKGNIARFIKETTLPFRELALDKGYDFKFKSSSTKIPLWFDRAKMEIIIYNLLSNAFKAIISDGKIEIRISEFEKNDKKGRLNSYVKIEVEDNGKGIPKKSIDNIFDRFYQLKENKKRNIDSSGIGLELTKRMIKIHNGEISVKSIEASKNQLGKTVFTVLIPIKNNYTSDDQVIVKNETSKKGSLYTTELLKTENCDFRIETENNTLDEILDFGTEKPVLMIIEDNNEVREFVSDLFKSNYKVRTAINGRDGWNKIVKIIPDIIISDVMMPEMDGLELCRIIKSDKRTCHIPIILLTARTSITFKYEGMETGADDYISKPFSAKYLAMRVKGLLQQRKLMQDHFFRNSVIQPKELGLTSVDETLLKKAIQYIEINLDNPQLSVENLSSHLGLSRVHLYRKLKSITNISAIEFIRNVRLKKAAQLFEIGNHSIKEVRYIVGISDATNFRNSFKKLYGVNPSDFIKQQWS